MSRAAILACAGVAAAAVGADLAIGTCGARLAHALFSFVLVQAIGAVTACLHSAAIALVPFRAHRAATIRCRRCRRGLELTGAAHAVVITLAIRRRRRGLSLPLCRSALQVRCANAV